MEKTVAEKWSEITHCPIIEGFGMSETSPVISLNHPDNNRLTTVGQVLPDTEIRIVDSTGEDVERGGQQDGEIWVRGPQVCQSYWQTLVRRLTLF